MAKIGFCADNVRLSERPAGAVHVQAALRPLEHLVPGRLPQQGLTAGLFQKRASSGALFFS